MPRNNPYLNRLPVTDPNEFFGRSDDVQRLLEHVTALEAPQCATVTGIRRLGKSSLLNYLAHPQGARQQFGEYFSEGGEILFVPLDLTFYLTEAGVPAETGGHSLVLRTLHRQLRRRARHVLPDASLAMPSDEAGFFHQTEALELIFEALEERDVRTIFLLDGLDAMRTIDQRLEDFLVRLTRQYPVAYIVSSLKPLHKLLEQGIDSYFYQIFTTHRLPLLAEEESFQLLTEPARRQGDSWDDPLTAALLEYTGGHPDLIKLAGNHRWHLQSAHGQPPALDEVLEAMRPDAHALFSSIYGHLQEEGREADEALLAVAHHRPIPTTGALASSLKDYGGVVFDTTGHPRLFSPLYAQWLRQQDSSSPDEDLRLDGRWITVGDRREQLTETEKMLAEILIAHRGQTVSRDMLQQYVWGEVSPNSKALDTTVQRLRDKIEEDRSKPQRLITIRGAGYTLK